MNSGKLYDKFLSEKNLFYLNQFGTLVGKFLKQNKT